MNNCELKNILPFNEPLILIDEIIKYDSEDKSLISKITINDKKPFFDRNINGIRSCVGISFMKQTISCYTYFKNNKQRTNIVILLGAKLMNCAVDKFEENKTYTIKSKEVFVNGENVAFDCIIYNEKNEEIASSTITVYYGNNI